MMVIAGAIILLAGAGTAAFAMAGRRGKTQNTAVSTARVIKTDLTARLSSTGILKPRATYQVTALTEGTVTESGFEEGSRVEKGQMLYQIDVTNAQSELALAESSLKRAQSGYDDAKQDYDTVQSRYSGGTWKSTERGYIKALHIKAGESVGPGTKIADIYDDRTMKLKVPFLNVEAAQIGAGAQGTVTLSATGEQIPGTVTAVSGKDEALTGGRLVRYVTVEVPNPGGLMPEQSASVTLGDYRSSMEGTFTPSYETVLSANVSDNVTVERMLVQEGDLLAPGTPVFSMDSQSAEKVIRSSKRALEQAEEIVSSAESKVESAKNSLQSYTVTAPISGTVIKKNSKVGDKLSRTGEASAMAVIYDMEEITFSMSIDELDIGKVKTGQKVEITADAVKDKTYQGTVTNVSLESQNSNGVTIYPVTVTVEKPEGLLPGMNVNGSIWLGESKNTLAVPAEALMRGNIVYVRGGEEQGETKGDKDTVKTGGEIPAGFREVVVETGIVSDRMVEITKGLSENDEVYLTPTESSSQENNMVTIDGY